MYRFANKLNSLDRGAAALLLIVMLFQLGACPCGCLEHNAWVQLLGLSDADEIRIANPVLDQDNCISVASADHAHDCIGEARPQFVDNSCTVQLRKASTTGEPQVSFFASARITALALQPPDRLLSKLSMFELDAAHCRPALQVYRL